jgi:hypothetical protein
LAVRKSEKVISSNVGANLNIATIRPNGFQAKYAFTGSDRCLQPEDALLERIWLLATDEIALIREEERLCSTNLPFAFSSVSLRNAFEAICDFGDSPLRCLGE